MAYLDKADMGFGDSIKQSTIEKQSDQRAWDLVRAYLEDKQYVRFDKIKASFQQQERDTDQRNRVSINLLKPIYRTLTSLMSTAYPGIKVTPSSASKDDVTKSLAAQMAIQYYWRQADMQYQLAKAIKWMLSTGNVAFHTFYDSGKGRIRTEVVSPYHLFFEPGVMEPEESEWLAIRQYVRRKELLKTYPDKAEIIENANALSERTERQLDRADRVPEDRLEVFEVYHEDGIHLWYLGNDILLEERMPAGARPIQFVRYTDIPGRLWGQGCFISLIDLQNQYNRSRNLLFDTCELMSNPMWLVPNSSKVPPGTLTNKPGKQIRFDPVGGAPQRVEGVSMPASFMENMRMIQAEILDIAGVHSTTMGKRAVNISSGKAIQALSALDVGQLQMSQQNLEKACREIARTVLILMKAYYKEGQMVRMLDLSGRVIHKQILATDLADDPEIDIEAGSLFRLESEDRDAQTLQYLDLKLITPEEARARLSLGLGDTESAKKMMAWSHAQELLAGAIGAYGEDKGIEILPTDDLEAIRQVFDEFVRSQDYYMLDEDRQQYVRNLLVSVSNPGQDPNAFAKAANEKIWPRQPNNPQDRAMDTVASAAPLAQAQVQAEADMMQQKHQELMAMRQSRGLDAAGPEQGV